MEKVKNNQFEIKPIERTPFAILEDKENQEIWIILGNEKIKQAATVEEAKIAATYYDWNLIGPVIYKVATAAAEKVYNDIKNK